MAPIIVHGIPGSPYVRMPLLACEEKHAPYHIEVMQFGQSKTPEYLARPSPVPPHAFAPSNNC